MGNVGEAIRSAFSETHTQSRLPVVFDGSVESARNELLYACEENIALRDNFLPEGYAFEFKHGRFGVVANSTGEYESMRFLLFQLQTSIEDRIRGNSNILLPIVDIIHTSKLQRLALTIAPYYLLFKRPSDVDRIASLHHTTDDDMKTETKGNVLEWYSTLSKIEEQFSQDRLDDIIAFAWSNQYINRLLFDPFSVHILRHILEQINNTGSQLNKLLILLSYLPEKS
jgi:hypothetical protein